MRGGDNLAHSAVENRPAGYMFCFCFLFISLFCIYFTTTSARAIISKHIGPIFARFLGSAVDDQFEISFSTPKGCCRGSHFSVLSICGFCPQRTQYIHIHQMAPTALSRS